jgi:hypothetical protein
VQTESVGFSMVNYHIDAPARSLSFLQTFRIPSVSSFCVYVYYIYIYVIEDLLKIPNELIDVCEFT